MEVPRDVVKLVICQVPSEGKQTTSCQDYLFHLQAQPQLQSQLQQIQLQLQAQLQLNDKLVLNYFVDFVLFQKDVSVYPSAANAAYAQNALYTKILRWASKTPGNAAVPGVSCLISLIFSLFLSHSLSFVSHLES